MVYPAWLSLDAQVLHLKLCKALSRSTLNFAAFSEHLETLLNLVTIVLQVMSTIALLLRMN